jgi:hypothetical protein
MGDEREQELMWMSKHPEKVNIYAGKWVAILHDEVIAAGDSVKSVMERVKRITQEMPLVTKIPRKDEEIYVL